MNISKTLPQGAISSFEFHTIELNVAFFCLQPVKQFRFVCDIGGIAFENDFEKRCLGELSYNFIIQTHIFKKREGMRRPIMLLEPNMDISYQVTYTLCN